MIFGPAGYWLAAHWRTVAVLAIMAALGLGLLWFRGDAARAERKAAELEGAYLFLAEKVKECNAASLAWEASASKAAQRARVAAERARAAEKAREARAVAFERAMRDPASPDAACPAGEGVDIVRREIRGEFRMPYPVPPPPPEPVPSVPAPVSAEVTP